MFQIRIHGRGGQGVVTGAELLSMAAFDQGMRAQAFPSFGSERMGAPVMAFCRISENEIRLREPVMNPDVLIIQDTTLLHQSDLFAGLNTSGYLVINTSRSPDALGLGDYFDQFAPNHIATIAASRLAQEYLGRASPNTALLGAFAALTGQVTLDSVCKAIPEKFPGAMGEKNIAVARAAHDAIRII
ncbi:Pyruvate:ferredoxin oxidoreductase, gamma subunit [hydrothermal vent metagenome]|uniref:Pyruvate:ferredoxin oxidoreductase, gamma subunit n=1 Tax=hydrothermal vent metagenome TaxID=652676 RepID=A0A3B0UU03_9ZZZZ